MQSIYHTGVHWLTAENMFPMLNKGLCHTRHDMTVASLQKAPSASVLLQSSFI
jgi:hypothetical protein